MRIASTFATGTKRLRPGEPHAYSLLAAALREHDLINAFLDGAVTPTQRLAVLKTMRLNARAWLRDEAQKLADELGTEKALFGRAREAVGAFFGKARKFVKESIVAGALVLSGPAPLSDARVRALDAAVAEQHAYLDRFHAEVLAEQTPVDPTFVARAEMYGSPVWGVPQNVVRSSLATGVAVSESRHHVGEDDPCDVCIEEQDRGVVPLGALLAIGDSPCRQACHCYFLFWDADGNPVDVYGDVVRG